jgi:mono/diheme cytochrome c family protein
MAPPRGAVLPAALLAVLFAGCSAARPHPGAQAPPQGAAAQPAPQSLAPRSSAPPAPESSARTPEGLTGSDLVVNDCVMCHETRLLQQQHLTAAQWTRTLDKMQTWGAPTEPGDLEVLSATLSHEYGSGAGRFEPETIPAARAEALFAPQPDGPLAAGKPERGRQLYDNLCVLCHAEEGKGGPQGIALAGRSILDRGPDFAQVIRTGRGGMPDFADTNDADTADLLAYLRSLK